LFFVEWILLAITGAFVWFWIFPDHDFQNPVGSFQWSGSVYKSYRYERHVLEEASKLERQRLGMEFHDTVLQSLHVITTDAATAYARFDEDPEGVSTRLLA
jgi:signal transduction histidine kinase